MQAERYKVILSLGLFLIVTN